MRTKTVLDPDRITVFIPSRGIRTIPHFKNFFPEFNKITSSRLRRATMVAGWGKKQTSVWAQTHAAENGLPYMALEDGFLRSFDLGVNGAAPLSLIIDRSGIYYDSTGPSDLETMIEQGGFDHESLARAESAIGVLRHEKLSKYNKGLITGPLPGPRIKRLIIDQTAHDASVLLSGADEGAFQRMIDDALALYAPGDIAVKLHPDTMAGKKGGYLTALSDKYGLRLIDKPYNPWDLLAQADEVATISSQLGFEALMAGKPVHCYGLPFYAGWGLTIDKLTCPRRNRQAKLEEIFAAAYLRYARYVDPYTGEASTLENTIDILSDRVRYERKAGRPAIALGFSPWKKRFIPAFAGGSGQVVFKRSLPADTAGRRIIVWAGRRAELIRKKRLKEKTIVTRMEDGFVRSRGLGAKLVRPWSLVLDDSGIYYDPRQASDLETILQAGVMSPHLIARAERLRVLLLDRNISKYNTGAFDRPPIPSRGRPVILVPGQVEDDASIKTGTVDIKTNIDLLKTVRLARPEALLRGKKTCCYGMPFYAGWGLTQDYYKNSRRSAKLDINQLVAGALILYPLYIDWHTREFTTVETVIRRLASPT